MFTIFFKSFKEMIYLVLSVAVCIASLTSSQSTMTCSRTSDTFQLSSTLSTVAEPTRGRAGKRGPKGDKGDMGLKGSKGEPNSSEHIEGGFVCSIFILLSRESDGGAIIWTNPHPLRNCPFPSFPVVFLTSYH